MKDIFDAKIMCEKCNLDMKRDFLDKGGFKVRTMKCENCGDKIVHPIDLAKAEHFKDLKGKEYNVKLRVIGNSHAISIPKEIVDFINEQEERMDKMIRLCFDDFRRLSLRF
tara:strand:- start:1149 stop:1481 length:333 start_codon:yes stop_codon:yes gene_type:complete